MKVIAVPTRMRWALAFLALCIPLAAFETILVTRSQWWRLPYGMVLGWSAAAALVFALMAFLIARGHRWSSVVVGAFGGGWALVSASYALRMQNYSIAFFTLFLALYWFTAHSWIKRELRRTFFDPQMRWYEGLPRGIPGLVCEIGPDTKLRVSRIDEDGLFVYSTSADGLGGLEAGAREGRKLLELTLDYFERKVSCRGFAVTRLEGGFGAGIQFAGMSPDSRKELGDFVEGLRGGGHV